MKLAILSDIHGNIEALESVLAFCDNNKVSDFASLGDVVGYGPNPNECVEMMENVAEIRIMGNHEHGVLGKTEISCFNQMAAEAVQWTQKTINEKSFDSISRYEFINSKGNILFTHASPSAPEKWKYVLNDKEAKEEIIYIGDSSICFIGHTHVPIAYSTEGIINQNKFELKNGNSYILNVGSVGQPRDGDRSASFGILDMEEMIYQYIKIEYPYKKTMKKIVEAGLPPFLGSRLALGI